MKQCKWCKELFDTDNKPNGFMGNHTRWCDKNPKKKEYIESMKSRPDIMREAKLKSGNHNQFSKAKNEGRLIEHSLKGEKHPNPFTGHTKESIDKIRSKALKSKHRRLRKGMVEYNGVMLDSSWELSLAKRLDYLGIKWVRPKPLIWVDEKGLEHNYFPDFYLLDYDLYLDPKNPVAYINQKEKVDILMNTYKNIVFVLTLKDCEEYEPPTKLD